MSAGVFLYILFILFYLYECVNFCRSDSIIIRIKFAGGGVIHGASSFPAAFKKKFFFSNPLSFSGDIFIFNKSVVNFLPDGILLNDQKLLYSEIKNISLQHDTITIGNYILNLSSTEIAEKNYKMIIEMKKKSVGERIKYAHDLLITSFDTDKIRTKYYNFKRKNSLMVFLTSVYFIYIAVVIPLIVNIFGYKKYFLLLLGLLVFFHLATMICYYYLHRCFYLSQKTERIINLFSVLLFPPAVLRFSDKLARDLFADLHPAAFFLSIFKNVGEEISFQNYIRELYYFDISQNKNKSEWLYNEIFNIIRIALEKNNIRIEDFFEKPERESLSSKAYCPCCMSQYTVEEGVCSDCNVSLMKY